MKEAGKYSSFNIITYLLLKEHSIEEQRNLAGFALIYGNDKVLKWILSMDLTSYGEYIQILIEKLNGEDIDLIQYEKEIIPKIEKYFPKLTNEEVGDLFEFLSFRLSNENLYIVIKLYDIISTQEWKDEYGEEEIIFMIDKGLNYSFAGEEVRNKFRDHVEKSFA